MNINEMTRAQFESLPHRERDKEIIFNTLVILPAQFDIWGYTKYQLKKLASQLFNLPAPDIWEVGHLHDSGYRRMDSVA